MSRSGIVTSCMESSAKRKRKPRVVKEIGKDSSSYFLLLVWERNAGSPLDDDLESTDSGKGEEVCPGKVGPTLGLNTAKVGHMVQEMPRVVGTGSESDITSGCETSGSQPGWHWRRVGFMLWLWQHPSMIPWVSLLRRQNEGIITDKEVTIP